MLWHFILGVWMTHLAFFRELLWEKTHRHKIRFPLNLSEINVHVFYLFTSVCVPLLSVLRECSSFSCWSRRCRRAACSESPLCLSACSWSRVCWCCFFRRRSLTLPSRTSSHSQRSLVWLVKWIQNQCMTAFDRGEVGWTLWALTVKFILKI